MKHTPRENISPGKPQTLVKEAHDRFLIANNFRKEEYMASTFTIGMGRIRLKLPNNRARQKAVPLHDLHHILTGYGTDWIGEAENGAWELRAGCNSFTVYLLDIAAVLPGLIISPRRVWQAFQVAKDHKTLYYDPLPFDSLLQMTVRELRIRLGIPPQGIDLD